MKGLKDTLGFVILAASVILGAWGGCAIGWSSYTGPQISWVSGSENGGLRAPSSG